MRPEPPTIGDPRLPRYQWEAQPWTHKGCVVCGDPDYQLHHAAYGVRPEMFVLVPLCDRHHFVFEREIWPRVRGGYVARWMATCAYIVNGEPFASFVQDRWSGPNRLHVNPDQLTLELVEPEPTTSGRPPTSRGSDP